MNFREKLGRLGAPVRRPTLAVESTSTARQVESDPERVERVSAVRGRIESCATEAVAQDSETAENDNQRAARIARLRSLIGEVVHRDAGRRERARAALHHEQAIVAQRSEDPSASSLRHEQRRAALQRAMQRATEPLGETLHRDSERPAWPAAEGRTDRAGLCAPWAARETAHGLLHLVERWLEPDHSHGRAPVRSAIDRLPATLASLALDPGLAELDLSAMLFLDTETTGLAGGTGTVAFLVGLAQFDDRVLKITQFVVPNLGGEVPMLRQLAERLDAASCVLTYNGKTFDWPLLRTRFVLNRVPVPPLPPHVDLLHAARRIWKPRLGSLRLTEVEREIMQFFREDDIDGSDIPARYFAFLRDGGSHRLAPIIEHNQNDLIALAAMLGTLGERFEQAERSEQPLDALAFGRLAVRLRDAERAQAFARTAVAVCHGSTLAPRALTFYGEVERRFGDSALAVNHFERALRLSPEPLAKASLHAMLAKLYEHELRDLHGAYRHARHTELAEGAFDQGKRLGRLVRKLERQANKRVRPSDVEP